MPSFPTLPQPLIDGAICVRLAAERDIPEVLIAYQDDRELHRRLGEERPPTGAELGRRAEHAEADRVAGRRLTMTIVECVDDTCVGQLDVDHVDWDHLGAELGVWVSPQRRGGGLGSRALGVAARWLILECGFQRVAVLTEPDNEPMIRAAERAGFTREGVLRGYRRRQGRRIDAFVMSLVRRDLRS
jgi:RimJ/RimL family protein N-acetyltransferase